MEIPLQASIFFLCIAFMYIITVADASGNDIGGGEKDRVALLAFKSNIHDPQMVMSSWNNSFHFCKWHGITCSRKHRRVAILDVESSGLVGTLSPYVGNMSFLREMRLSNNTIQGEIPPEIGRLFRLQVLSLSYNSLEGEIPASIFRCSNLVNLTLRENKLVGKIPEELGSLSKLKVLNIAYNNLTGGIPSFIGNLTSLESLSAAANNFGGSIPDAFGLLKNLRNIGFGANDLSGTVPPSIYNLSLLTILSLGHNQLGGSLPSNFGLLFPHLQLLQFGVNSFTGSIPSSLSNATEFEIVELDYNNFIGKVSVDFRGMEFLSWILLDGNNLGTGEADEMRFLISLLNCSNLEVVSLPDNHFRGALPNSVGNLSTQLEVLDISRNQISGGIPSWIDTLVHLTELVLENNQLTGPNPDIISKLTTLQRMSLGNNKLSGNIPFSLGNLTILNSLYLNANKFRGTIPSSLGNCQNLLVLNLSQNSLSGNIPKQLFNLSALSISLDLAQNYLVGSLPSIVGNLKHLGELKVAENKLSGEIPSGLAGCISLEKLYMGGNFFQGSIPKSLSSLRGIQVIDLSRNNLSGKIPEFLEKFSLSYLNLSFNDFEGDIPTKGVFKNATAVSVVGNKKLCGGIPELKFRSCPAIESSKKRNISFVAKILISIACVLVGVALVSYFVLFLFKKTKKEQTSSSLLEKSILQVSYAMLLKATDGFSTANLIGVGSFGSVYKGILDQVEEIVAIKVLNLQRRGASKSFMAECESLRNIRHRNLVKIITSCSSTDFQNNDFKAIVYEFMSNGSLEKWLHPMPQTDADQDDHQNLNHLQRTNIAIDVACVLEYLHHQCQQPIVHCDLKPSNILLDSDKTAHVGDFGLAKILQEFTNQNENSSIGLRGTIGYAAPEYGLGSEVSTSGDVYSYGIVLLEMMTGKKPTDSMFDEGLSLHKLARMSLPDQVMDIIDPILLNVHEEVAAPSNRSLRRERNGNKTDEEECLISMVKIGVACSMESPPDRMNMTDVLHQLHRIRDSLQSSRNWN